MFKTFLGGAILGIVAAVVAAGWLPIVQHERVVSITTSQPNGGRLEAFVIRLPEDRLSRNEVNFTKTDVFDNGQSAMAPGVTVPASAELFRLRNTDDEVIGIASRLSGQTNQAEGFSDWVLYLPARGALFLTVKHSLGEPYRRLTPGGDSVEFRASGAVISGSDEFAGLTGLFSENWQLTGDGTVASVSGVINLSTAVRGRGR